MMNLKQQLGQRIKELRIKNNLTQSALVEKVNIATKYQSCVETGNSYPSAELIEKYAKVFNIEPSEVLSINNSKIKTELINKINKQLENLSISKLEELYNHIID